MDRLPEKIKTEIEDIFKSYPKDFYISHRHTPWATPAGISFQIETVMGKGTIFVLECPDSVNIKQYEINIKL